MEESVMSLENTAIDQNGVMEQSETYDPCKIITEAFRIPGQPLQSYSPLALAFLGDGVYEIIVRTIIVSKGNVSPAKLHQHSAHLVKASSQAALIEAILPDLTEEEADINRRGRNAKSNTHAKNASVIDYRKATGLEALIGYLYLKGESERALYLIKLGLEKGKFL